MYKHNYFPAVFALSLLNLAMLLAIPSSSVIAQSVVVYEDINYKGRSKEFKIGTYRLQTAKDLNDVITSVKVPKGLIILAHELADDKGGKGNSIDLNQDCADLKKLNFDNKITYISIFYSTKDDKYEWVVGSLGNAGVFVPGHWERIKPGGPSTRTDLTYAFPATKEEIDEFKKIRNTQMGVGILGGETKEPFYYHPIQPKNNEKVYKYDKYVDASKLPGEILVKIGDKIGPLEGPLDYIAGLGASAIDEVKGWFGSKKEKETKLNRIDCWYPTSEFKQTVCGTMKEPAYICPQDYEHTELTIDRDVNLNIIPSNAFLPYLKNRWLIDEKYTTVEGEVLPQMFANSLTPRNPLLLKIGRGDKVCVFGPWMADNLDIEMLGNKGELHNNNEIHPMNQIWYKNGNETTLIAIADGTGYFNKIGPGEIEASGLNQKMSFSVAFEIPANILNSPDTLKRIEYIINGVGFGFKSKTVAPIDIKPETHVFKYKGIRRFILTQNIIAVEKTHSISFEKIKSLPDGSIQGYIVIETEKIDNPGGSINIFVKQTKP